MADCSRHHHAHASHASHHEPTIPHVSEDDAPFELIYWPHTPGRGEFVRLLFEEAGVRYTDVAKNEAEALKTIEAITGPENKGDEFNPPIFACPVLKHGDLVLNQTSNILMYLAPRMGLVPVDSNGLFHLNQIVLTILDGFVNEVHDTHHPVAISAVYEDQKTEAKRRAKNFTSERLPNFLAYAQRLLHAPTSGKGPWLYGTKLTYADLVLFQAIDGTKFAFPKNMEKLQKSGNYGGVFKLYDAVKARPNIKAYLESDRRNGYSHGIYRHYAELDEE